MQLEHIIHKVTVLLGLLMRMCRQDNEGRNLYFCSFMSHCRFADYCNIYWSYSVFDGGSTLKQDTQLNGCLVLIKARGNFFCQTLRYSRSYKVYYFEMCYNAVVGNTWQSGGQFELFNYTAQLQKDLCLASACECCDIISQVVNCSCTAALFLLIYKRHIHFIMHW